MRKSGILMHISSLPSEFGIGKLGDSAYMFANFLRDCGVQVWQILPLCPTGFGNRPYQSFSCAAGDPYFIDLDLLCEEGLLRPEEYRGIDFGRDPQLIDYDKLEQHRLPVLRPVGKSRCSSFVLPDLSSFVRIAVPDQSAAGRPPGIPLWLLPLPVLQPAIRFRSAGWQCGRWLSGDGLCRKQLPRRSQPEKAC